MSELQQQHNNLLNDLENIRFYLQTPEQAGGALVFAKKLKEFSAKLETKVKDRAREIMNEKNVEEIEFGDFVAKIVPPTELKVYDPESVINALGQEKAKPLMTVKAGELEKYLTKAERQGEITFDVIKACRENLDTKPRAGSIQVKEKVKK